MSVSRTNRYKLPATLAIVAVCVVVLSMDAKKSEHDSETHSEPSHVSQFLSAFSSKTSKHAPSAKSASNTSMQVSATQQGNERALEQATIRTLSTLVADAFRETHEPSRMIEKLKLQGYEPVVANNSNSATGSMVMIRTKNALPGSRYLHAQYFTDENGDFYPQHISFEFSPKHTMKEVVLSLNSSFGNLGKPYFVSKERIAFELENHYMLEIKRLSQDNMRDSAFNAYSPADQGTVRVSFEKIPAGHEEAI